ncbi:MAG: hypothetical protein NT116_00805 [Candidatus Parcubacteria bacterium]|nr:hypothetical protein [Candidatus Parcubacteria bacterium]
MNRTLKVFIACAFGAGIGAMIALQIGGYLWWIGMIAGALIGYLSYEFKAVISAVVFAWKKVTAKHPDQIAIKKTTSTLFWAMMFIGNMSAIAIPYITFIVPQIKFRFPIIASFPITSLLIILAPLYLGICWLAQELAKGDELKERNLTFLLINPLFLFTLGPITFLYLTAICFKKTIFPFCKTLFLLIHSEIRLLCFFDAGIGAGIGYFTGNALIGAICGGVLGVINYEIVSKRLLKLAPAKS